MDLNINGLLVKVDQYKKEVIVFFQNEEQMEKFKEESKYLKKTFKDYDIKSFMIRESIIDKLSEDYDTIINKRSLLNQAVNTIGELVSYESKIIRSSLYLNKATFKVINLNKSFDIIMFTKKSSESLFNSSKYFNIKGVFQLDEWTNENGRSRFERENDILKYVIKADAITPINNMEFEIPNKPTFHRKEFHLHTKYSNNDAFITAEDIDKAYNNGLFSSIGLTDHGNIQALNYFKKEIKSNIKINCGMEAYMWDDINEPESHHDSKRYHIIIYLREPDGELVYKGNKIKINHGIVMLNKLITDAYTNTFSTPTINKKQGKRAVIPKSILMDPEVRKYFIYGSACVYGEVKWSVMAGSPIEKVKEIASFYDYLEIMPVHNDLFAIESEDYPIIESVESLKVVNRIIYNVGKELNKPVIMTSDAHIMFKEDREVRLWFQRSIFAMYKGRGSKENPMDVYKEMILETQPYALTYNNVLDELKDQGFNNTEVKEIIDNETVIDNWLVALKDITIVPNFLFIPYIEGLDIKTEFPKRIWTAANEYYKFGIPDKIKDRIQYELEKTQLKEFEIMYWNAADIVDKSEELGYPIGARGSVGSSILAWLLRVSENNPVEPHYYCKECGYIEWVDTKILGIDLPKKECPICNNKKLICDGLDIDFSSFVGEDGTKIADIDINIASEIQSEVQQYIIDLFGKDKTSKSGTLRFYNEDSIKSTLLAKLPLIKEHVKNEDFDVDYITSKINGTKSGLGSHPAGVIVIPKDAKFEWVTALSLPSESNDDRDYLSTMLPFHEVENSIVKLDILGHTAPGMLKRLKDLTGVDFKTIDVTDPNLINMIKNISAIGINPDDFFMSQGGLGIPELGTNTTVDVIAALKPKNITDIIRIQGICHGENLWRSNIDKLIEQGKTIDEVPTTRDEVYKVLYTSGIDKKTSFSIIDKLRKGKPLPQEQKDIMYKHLPSWYVDSCLKITYMFPLSHAVSYSLTAMRCAFYKFYYPSEWYRVLLENWAQSVSSFEYDEARKIRNKTQLENMCKRIRKEESQDAQAKFKMRLVHLIYEMHLRGYELLDGNLYSAPTSFVIEGNPREIYRPLVSLNGISDLTAEKIYKTLQEKPFTTCEDIIERRDENNRCIFNKKHLKNLGIIYKEKCEKCLKYVVCMENKKIKGFLEEKVIDNIE